VWNRERFGQLRNWGLILDFMKELKNRGKKCLELNGLGDWKDRVR
jgi:hypothetical protein